MTYQLDSSARLLDTEFKQPGVRWPVAIDVRLGELVDLANSEGAGATRQDLAAALVLAAEPDATLLARYVVDFRKARVEDALLGRYPDGVPRRPPGRSLSVGQGSADQESRKP